MKSISPELLKKTKTVGWSIALIVVNLIFLGIFRELLDSALISFKNLCLISAVPTLFTCIYFLKIGFGELFKNVLGVLGIVAMLMFLWSFVILLINYIPIIRNIETNNYPIISFKLKSFKSSTPNVYVLIKYPKKILKVEVFGYSPPALNQFNELKLKTRKGLIGIDIALEKELIKSDKKINQTMLK